MRLVSGKIRVKFSEADYGMIIDTSYKDKEMRSVKGEVIGTGDLAVPYEYRFSDEYNSIYFINEGVVVGDRVILRWAGVSGCIIEGGEATIGYEEVIGVERDGGVVLKNRYLMLDSDFKVVGVSTDSDIEVQLGEYIFPRYVFRIEYMYEDRWFTDDKDIIAAGDKKIDKEWMII